MEDTCLIRLLLGLNLNSTGLSQSLVFQTMTISLTISDKIDARLYSESTAIYLSIVYYLLSAVWLMYNITQTITCETVTLC